LAGALLASTLALFAPTAARADDPRWAFPAGSKASATLAAGESHLFGVRLVEGTSYTATLVGKKGFAPRLELLDPALAPVATSDTLTTTGSKTTLSKFLATRTGEYLLRVTGPTTGSYVLISKGTPSRGGTFPTSIVLVGETANWPFTATSGGTAILTVKPARRSTAQPLVVAVRDPQSADVPLERRKTTTKLDSCSVACPTSGKYMLTVGAAAGTVGELTVTVKVVTPKVKPVSLKIDGSTRVPDFAWFSAKIQPIFQNRGCNSSGCHGAVNGQGRMILRGPPSGPFSLEETYWNYFQLSRWVEVGNPQSRALLKPLYIEDGGIYHGGGDVFRKADPEYQPFLDWVMGESLASIPPVARAGSDVHGFVGTPALLNGEASSDPENQPLTYQWTLMSTPGGSTAQIVPANSARPTLTPDRSGVYLCRLVVTDSAGVASAPSQVAVTADANAQAGVITFEAENGSISGDFAVGDDVAASNGKYLTRVAGPQDGVASYLFSLDEAGDYAVWGRLLATSNLHDALRLRVDGGPVFTWEAPIAEGWKFSRANDRMNRRALVAGASLLDPIPVGGTNWFELRAESVDLRALAMTGARMRHGAIDAKMRFDTKRTGYIRNALVVFDWLDDRNYLFAGMSDNANLVYIGRVAQGLRTNDVAMAFTVNSNQNYQFRAAIDPDGTVHALVDGVERATYKFDPAVRGIDGGLVGMATERNTNSMSVGWFDDLVVTDSVEGVVWSDDFETTPWTDPVFLTLDAGQHQLDVLAGETDVKLDRLVVAPAALDPSGAVGETRLVRRMYFDAANRSPTNDELILAPFLTTDGVADQLVGDYGYYLGWYEKSLVQFNLVGLNAPKTNDADYQTLSSIPARLTNGEITEIQALGEIAKSAAWARLNADARDFAYSLFEEFLDRKPSTTTPPGGRSEYTAATNIYNLTPTSLFGEVGASPSDLVDIVLGLNGRNPNYNANLPGGLAPDTQALFRGQIQLAWKRLVPTTPIASSDLATWTAEYSADPTKVRATVATILKTDAYQGDAQTPRPKTPRQFIRGLYVDVLGRNPDFDTVGNLEHSFVSAGDPAPLAGELVQQMLRSPDANPATPAVAGLDVDAWLSSTFVRTLGRLPTESEVLVFKGALLSTTVVTTTDIELEAVLTSQEYLYY
jgi:hypothetical protein